MHGQIGKPKSRTSTHRHAGDFYHNRAAFLDACRRMGDGGIDHDFYRARARRERNLAIRRHLRGVTPMLRPLITAGIVLAAIWLMLTLAEGCADCTAAPQRTCRQAVSGAELTQLHPGWKTDRHAWPAHSLPAMPQ